MQAQMGEPTNKEAPNFTREYIKEIFFKSEERKFERAKTVLQN